MENNNMLCSDCKKNTAVIFVNTKNKDGEITKKGYCYDCAKKRGINPLNTFSNSANLSDNDINNMTNQLNEMFKDLSANLSIQGINPEDLQKLQEEAAESESNSEEDATVADPDAENATPMGFAVPLGSIFSGMFGKKENDDSENRSE